VYRLIKLDVTFLHDYSFTPNNFITPVLVAVTNAKNHIAPKKANFCPADQELNMPFHKTTFYHIFSRSSKLYIFICV